MMFNHCASLAAGLALASVSQATSFADNTNDLVACLKSSLSSEGSIILPSQPAFAKDIARYSALYNPKFNVVSAVANEQDVRGSIQCATKTNTTFFVTGARHGTDTQLVKVKNGLEIFTNAFNKLSVDTAANTVTCEGAVQFQQVIDALYAAKKQIPTGNGVDVGILGATSGAGIGRLQGLNGLLIDSLQSVRLMLPNTTVIEVSEQKNPDLFWGMRGAGWNFGFVLNATYQVYDEVPNGMHLNADLLVPSNLTRAFYQKLKDEAPLPAPLAFTSALVYDTDYNDTTLTINAVYAGPEAEGRKAMKFLMDLKPVLKKKISYVPWNKLIQTSYFGKGANDVSKGKILRSNYGVAFNQIDPDAQVEMTRTFQEMIKKYPQTAISTAALYYPATEAVKAVPVNSTAYGWRDALGHMAFEITFTNKSSLDIDNYGAKLRDIIQATAGTPALEVYVGFSRGSEPIESIWSKDSLPRLAALKKKYDPSGLFNAYHPLPTEYPVRS